MVVRKNNAKPEPAPRTGGESSTVPGVSDAPGDGTVTVPLGRRDQHGSRPGRNAAVWGDVMQRRVGGGEIKEHEYRDVPDAPDAEEDRRE